MSKPTRDEVREVVRKHYSGPMRGLCDGIMELFEDKPVIEWEQRFNAYLINEIKCDFTEADRARDSAISKIKNFIRKEFKEMGLELKYTSLSRPYDKVSAHEESYWVDEKVDEALKKRGIG